MSEPKTKYVGMGLYISRWKIDGGRLRRDDFSLESMAPEVSWADTDNLDFYAGTFATYAEISSGQPPQEQ